MRRLAVILVSVIVLAAITSRGDDFDPPASQPAAKACRVRLVAPKEEYLIGEPVRIEYLLENRGGQPVEISYGGDYRGSARSERFRVTVTDAANHEMPDAIDHEMNMGGLLGMKTIAAGGAWVESIDLNLYRRVLEPGVYRVRIVHDLGWKDPPAPAGEITLRFRLPREQEARKLATETSQPAWLVHPVYLPMLLDLVAKDRKRALAGIASIQTSESTAVLIGLIDRELDRADAADLDLTLAAYGAMHDRLPDPRYVTYGDSAVVDRERVRQTWRAEFAVTLRRLASRLAEDPNSLGLDAINFIYECVGVAADLPDLTLGYTKAIEATLTLPFETHQYFRPRGSAYGYRFGVPALLKRGAAPPVDPKTPGEILVYMIAMRTDEHFRPEGWQTRVFGFLQHDIPYLRETVLEYMPEPVPDAVLDALPQQLTHSYVDLKIAACHMAEKHPRPAFAKPIRDILHNGREQYLLNAATAAAPRNDVPKDEVMTIWVARMNNEDLGGKAVTRLLLAILEDNQWKSQDKLDLAALDAARRRWTQFIDAERDALRAGRTFKIGDAEITPDLFPPGFGWYDHGKPWPPANNVAPAK